MLSFASWIQDSYHKRFSTQNSKSDLTQRVHPNFKHFPLLTSSIRKYFPAVFSPFSKSLSLSLPSNDCLRVIFKRTREGGRNFLNFVQSAQESQLTFINSKERSAQIFKPNKIKEKHNEDENTKVRLYILNRITWVNSEGFILIGLCSENLFSRRCGK